MLDNLISDLGLKFVGDRKFRFGIFKCKKCNKEFEIQIRRKTKGELCKSCNTIKSKSTHNKTRTKLYYIWTSMKDRCYREKTNSFPLYGGRGITICDEWKSNFIFFYDKRRSRHNNSMVKLFYIKSHYETFFERSFGLLRRWLLY